MGTESGAEVSTLAAAAGRGRAEAEPEGAAVGSDVAGSPGLFADEATDSVDAPMTNGGSASGPQVKEAPTEAVRAAAVAKPSGARGGTAANGASMGWLLRLFRSDFFDAWMAVTYLYRYRKTRGVLEYLCNELYNLNLDELELYLPQLCNILVFHARDSTALEKFIMDKCAESMHFALEVYWFLQAALEDSRSKEMLKRCDLLRTRCETAAVNGYSDTLLMSSPTALADLMGYDFVQLSVSDSGELQVLADVTDGDSPRGAGAARSPTEGRRERPAVDATVTDADVTAQNRLPRGESVGRVRRSQSAGVLGKASDVVDEHESSTIAGDEHTATRRRSRSHTVAATVGATARARAVAAQVLESVLHTVVHDLAGETPRKRRTAPTARPAAPGPSWPPTPNQRAQLLATKQERFDYFNDSLAFVRALVRVSLRLRAVPLNRRSAVLAHALEQISDTLLQRMAGMQFSGMTSTTPSDDPASKLTAEQVARLCPRAALRSIHLPLSRCNETVLRVLRVVSAESTILSSKERVPILVYVEVLETTMTCLDRNVFCQHLASEDRLREMEQELQLEPRATADGSPRDAFEPVAVVPLEELDVAEEHGPVVRMASPSKPPAAPTATPKALATRSRLLPRYAHLASGASAHHGTLSYSALLDVRHHRHRRSRSWSFDAPPRPPARAAPETSHRTESDGAEPPRSQSMLSRIAEVVHATPHGGSDTPERPSPTGTRRDPRTIQRLLVSEAVHGKRSAPDEWRLPLETLADAVPESLAGEAFWQAPAHVPRGVNFHEEVRDDAEEGAISPATPRSVWREREATLLAVYGEMWEWKEERVRRASPFGHLPTWRLASFIVKAGDDLRQEQLAVQLVDQMLRIFEEECLPLWLRPFTIVCVSHDAGLVETIPDAVSVHSLKKRTPGFVSLRDYFERAYGGPSSATFCKALRNFVESMAGYSLVTYLLQVRDRHNGNIMLAASGHVVHIDFGFMLGNSPGSIRFEAAPFKLSPEYLQVMGGVHSEAYHYFRELVVNGFLACRKHHEKITTLTEVMIEGTRMPCMTGGMSVVESLRSRFMLSLTERECIRAMLSLVDESADNWRTRQYDRYQFFSNGIL
ncbi:hypothetical protein CDCA_CDCA01G0265 [Cyanidium caldarium]|uniref:1-phosphatidylinositol 4-kinase n=1 Tax=Cyanidium caldarium TaxID=2771 RepID=A0AAV9IQ68_CYACA|nr:hypothetical protein CDCA_CDCA01G0265 [Cyanidium caldarium]